MEKNIKKDVVINPQIIASEGYKDYQKIRINQNNRIRDVVRRKIEKIPMDHPEEKKERKEYLKKFQDKEIIKYLYKLKSKDKITKYEFDYISKLLGIAKETYQTEQNYKKLMDRFLKKEDIWKDWLIKIKGISSVLGSELLRRFGYCENYVYVSKLWCHTGMSPDGAKGKKKGEGICYNPLLKTFVFNIGESLIRQNSPYYKDFYNSCKEKELIKSYSFDIDDKNNIVGDVLDCDIGCFKDGTKLKNDNYAKFVKEAKRLGVEKVNIRLSDGHAHSRARRKMIKVFLQHYWVVSRKIKGLPLTLPYQFDKLDHKTYDMPPFCPFTFEELFGDVV